MTEAVMEQKEEVSYLDMSDEDIAKAAPPSFEKEETPEPEVESGAGDSEAAVGDQPDADDADDAPVESKEKAPAEEAVTPDAPTESAVDYKAAYERLLAPFKANGRDVTVSNVEDAIALMQMGANYNKKMAALKPNLKLMKLLENNGMLNESRISFLIDLEKKSPEAINKLVKDSGIDPLDLNAEKAGEYQPKTYTVDDKELELESVLNDIQETPTYTRTLDIVSTKWDSTSKQTIANAPQLLKVINSHMQSGVFDEIAKSVESERMFGRLSGLSDIEAYRQVGDAIQARGGFNHLGHQGNQAPSQPVIVQPNPKIAGTDKLRDKKLAASTSKPAGASHVKDYDPLAMSDEDFSKLTKPKFS